MLNKYNIKMTGLKTAAGETKCLTGFNDGRYVQISYDIADGQILTDLHCCFGHNSCSVYSSDSVVTITNLDEPTTMQEIANLVKMRLDYIAHTQAGAC